MLREWISDYIHIKEWHVVTLQGPNFKDPLSLALNLDELLLHTGN